MMAPMPFGLGSRKPDTPSSPFGGNTTSGSLPGAHPVPAPREAGARAAPSRTSAAHAPHDAEPHPADLEALERARATAAVHATAADLTRRADRLSARAGLPTYPDGAPSRPGPGARTVARPRVVAVIGWTLLVALGVGMALEGSVGMVLFGGLWAIGLGSLFVLVLRSRVVVDGDLLYARGVRGWRRPVDLRHLRRGGIATGANHERWVVLRDGHGAELRIDAVNLQVTGLYRELGARIGPWQGVADEDLEHRIARHR